MTRGKEWLGARPGAQPRARGGSAGLGPIRAPRGACKARKGAGRYYPRGEGRQGLRGACRASQGGKARGCTGMPGEGEGRA